MCKGNFFLLIDTVNIKTKLYAHVDLKLFPYSVLF
jgi:hypothetical protein